MERGGIGRLCHSASSVELSKSASISSICPFKKSFLRSFRAHGLALRELARLEALCQLHQAEQEVCWKWRGRERKKVPERNKEDEREIEIERKKDAELK